MTGVKGNYGTIGVNAKVLRAGNDKKSMPKLECEAGNNENHHTHSIAQWALKAGKSIGLVTTTRGIN